jgi:hypothetical protein
MTFSLSDSVLQICERHLLIYDKAFANHPLLMLANTDQLGLFGYYSLLCPGSTELLKLELSEVRYDLQFCFLYVHEHVLNNGAFAF